MRIMTYWKHGQGIWLLHFQGAFRGQRCGISRRKICQSSRKQKEIIAPEVVSFLMNTLLILTAFLKITAAFISRSNSSSLRSCSSFSLWREIDAIETVSPQPMEFVYLLVVGPVSFHNNPNFWITTGSAAKFMIWCIRRWHLIRVFDSNTLIKRDPIAL